MNLTLFSSLLMTLLQEGNLKEIFKTDEGNFVQNEEKLSAKQEILCCKSGNPASNICKQDGRGRKR